jgi:hypothetical protein
MARLDNSTVRAYIGSSGGSGPYYQLYWINSSTAPSSTNYDAASNTSTVMEDFSFSNGITYYFYIRSSSENLGNTITGGTGTAGTYSDYGPTTGAASYTFVSPSGGTGSISGSTSVGSTLTLSAVSPTASPAADITSIIWRRASGGTGGNSFTGGSIMQTGGTTYVIDSTVVGFSSVGYQIRAEVTWNNGVGSQSANSNAITVTSSGVAPSGGGVTLTPTGTQQAGTVISANVTAMSGTAPITYVTTIRKATGSSPTGTGTVTTPRAGLTNPGTGTGNAVAQHEITSGEASGTPDQFKAYTVGSNAYGDFTVGSNTVISTPYVATQYTVTWNANGGTGGTTTTQDAGTAHSAPAATRSGYTLSNWRNPQTGGDPIFVSAGGTYTPTASITFWAQWTAVVVSAPSGGTATSTPSTGTAGTTTYVGSTSGWSGSPTSYTYSWQYFSQNSFTWVQYSSGTNFSPPSGINSTYPNYGWQLSVGATNSGGTTYATTSITVSNPTVVTAPSTPTGLALTGSGAVSWDAVSGATSYEVLTYTDRTGSPANTTNRLGPYVATGITGTTYQLSSTDNYASPNNYARVQVRARNSAGVSTYSAWVPSSTTYT